MSEAKVSPKMIEHYLKHFYGYGSWDTDYWFVGLEEGTGTATINGKKTDNPIDIFKQKVNRFCKICCSKTEPYYYRCNTKESLLDNYNFQYDLYPGYFDETSYCSKGNLPQATHKQLIRILYYIKTGIFLEQNKDIKKLQATDFGNTNPTCLSQHCAIELLPFPSPLRTNVKIIKEYKDAIPGFNSSTKQQDYKKEYERICFSEKAMGRISFLKNQLATKKPKLVTFYAPEYFHTILNITQSKYKDWNFFNLLSSSILESHSIAYWYNGETVFILVNHPARCKNREYWECVCLRAKQLLSTLFAG